MNRTLTRVLAVSGLVPLALALTVAASAAASKPRAVLVKQADAICRADEAKRAKEPAPPAQNPAKATPAQLKAMVPFMQRDLAITVDEVHRAFALGTPAEPAARAAWTKLHTVLVGGMIPDFERAIAAMKRGDRAATLRAFTRLDRLGPTQTKLENALGLKVCGRG